MAARPPAPEVLEGRYIRLEPLSVAHVPDLYFAEDGRGAAWSWLPVLPPRSQYEMRLIVEQRLAQQAAGGAVLFAVIDRGSDRAAGWIAYLDICVADERLDVGWHWLGHPLSGTSAALEMHLLLMQHAFDTLGFSRVQWQVDHLDYEAQEAMLRIGATREGLLRRHLRRPDGTWRDTVFYGVLAPDFPMIKERIRAGLILG
jgi:RimJ/RimL family protein N-acetyltransferase